MPGYHPQVASIQVYDSLPDAACFNVGNHPDAEQRDKPYRVIVIPECAWHEFEVFSESIRGEQDFKAYPSEHPTLKRP